MLYKCENFNKLIAERRWLIVNWLISDVNCLYFAVIQTLSLVNGITCAAYNGSVVESAARLLVDTVGESLSVCLSVCLSV